jgi:glycosyltransferase involved in cell wall biosynthesis
MRCDRIIGTSRMSSVRQLTDPGQGSDSPPIGVVIPTYNRSTVLLSCLRRLEHQTYPDFEVVIVDDGSTQPVEKMLEEYARESRLRISYLRQENSGPARARNAAIDALQTPICLMIGDDILVSPGFVSSHLELHRKRPEANVAGLGLTRWSESEQQVTKFMRWLDETGIQFAYNDLLRGMRPTWNHFYSSNLSLKTQLLRENPFNENFPGAAMEDMELGYRLQRRHALEIVFLPEAVAEHVHPTSFTQACKRMVNVGASTRLLRELCPDIPSEGNPEVRRIRRSVAARFLWLLPGLTPLADLSGRLWSPNPLMRIVMQLHYLAGYRKDRIQKPNQNPA